MIHNILFDFDGVILDSMPIRDKGFEIIFSKFPKNQVDLLLAFHKQNGGLSRYVKIRHFFEIIRDEKITDAEVLTYAEEFSKVMVEELTDPELLIEDSLTFIKNNYQKYQMHIVSASDQNELRYLCSRLSIDKYFKTIQGSPIEKKVVVGNILREFNYNIIETVLIGDSVNDRDAAVYNSIEFLGYNNSILNDPTINKYINSFKDQSLI